MQTNPIHSYAYSHHIGITNRWTPLRIAKQMHQLNLKWTNLCLVEWTSRMFLIIWTSKGVSSLCPSIFNLGDPQIIANPVLKIKSCYFLQWSLRKFGSVHSSKAHLSMKCKEMLIRISYSNAGPVNKVQYIQLNHFECFLLDRKLFFSNECMEGLVAEKKPQFLIEYTETLNISKCTKIYQYLHFQLQKKTYQKTNQKMPGKIFRVYYLYLILKAHSLC